MNINVLMCVYFVLSILIVVNDYEQKIITNNIPSMKLQSWCGGMYFEYLYFEECICAILSGIAIDVIF